MARGKVTSHSAPIQIRPGQTSCRMRNGASRPLATSAQRSGLLPTIAPAAKSVEKFPILKGARINLGVENLFDSRVDVTSAGDLPLNYQPDYLDPRGRVVQFTVRKLLF